MHHLGDANSFVFFLRVDSVCHVQVMGRSLVSRYRQMRELAMVYMLLGPVQFVDEQDEAEADLLHML